MEHIRKNVLGLTQGALATLTGVTQATVSRWEAGELEPGRHELDCIRNEARDRGLVWDDRWFFETPPTVHDDETAPQPERQVS